MMNIVQIFEVLSKQHHVAIISFIIIIIFSVKFYEIFFMKFVRSKIKDFGDENKNIPFDIFLTGIFLLVVGLILDIFVEYPFTWYLCTFFLILGGLLGILPFSFLKKK